MNARFQNLVFHDPARKYQAEPIELTDFGQDMLASEALTDTAYRFFLLLMGKLYAGEWTALTDFRVDLAKTLQNGVYLPCVSRTVLVGCLDRRNDGPPPAFAAVMDAACADDISVCSVRRLERFPRGIVPTLPGEPYKVVQFYRSHANRHKRRSNRKETDVVMAADTFSTISGDRVVQAHLNCAPTFNTAFNSAVARAWPALVFGLWSDRKYLWQVRTADHVIDSVATPLMLGVSPEHVKSLFYARQLPVTETGRKRPILHWVRAHERRIQAGIDVDVRRHLRGIERFEMDGLSFEITSPHKEPPP